MNMRDRLAGFIVTAAAQVHNRDLQGILVPHAVLWLGGRCSSPLLSQQPSCADQVADNDNGSQTS